MRVSCSSPAFVIPIFVCSMPTFCYILIALTIYFSEHSAERSKNMVHCPLPLAVEVRAHLVGHCPLPLAVEVRFHLVQAGPYVIGRYDGPPQARGPGQSPGLDV